jgi:hypothetical protein
MKTGMARALVLATAMVVSCGKSSSSTGDAGPHGPTNIVVKWTIAGKAASASSCDAQGAKQVFVNLSGTIDVSLHKSVTVDCEKGTTTFTDLLVEDLGEPYLEGTLLDEKGMSVPMGIVGVNLMPVPGTTNVTLDFFPPMNMGGGGMGGMMTTSSTTSSTTTTTSSGMGGSGGGTTSSTTATTSSGSGGGGTGGADAGP